MSATRRAAILLIGGELLSGRIQDENLVFLARELWSLGVDLERVVVVGDDASRIAREVRELAAAHDWVFTTGGIGPTHDDVTIEAVARAFDVAVVSAPSLEQRLRQFFAERLLPAHLRMARVPAGAVLEGDDDGSWPTVRKENVYILPGVPSILRRKFARLRETFRGAPYHRLTLELIADEASLAPILDRAAVRFAPEVTIGSYPIDERVTLTFEGRDLAKVEIAARAVERETGGLPRP